jgi:hypothetical protein
MALYIWCAKKWHGLERIIASRLWRLSADDDIKYLGGPANTHPLEQESP